MSETPPNPNPPPRRRYSDSAPPETPKLPFAYQAAKVTLAAPFIALALLLASLFLLSTLEPDTQRTIRQVLGLLIDLLVLTGLITGVIALLAVRRLGGKGLLARSVGGVIASVLLLAIVGLSIYNTVYGPAARIRALSAHLVGSWESILPANGKTVHVFMILNTDGTGRWKIDAQPGIDTATKWAIRPQKTDGRPVLLLQFEPPVEKPQHIEGVHWTITSASDSQLTLANTKEDGSTSVETYVRVR